MTKKKKTPSNATEVVRMRKTKHSGKDITTSSTAEYFAKNLQQVGFSSQTKAVLTTLKEAVDNSLDACEENGILPELWVEIEKVGAGTLKNSDQIRIRVSDNGPGIGVDDIPKVFGEYLASSKFGRGRCSRGQQGIGISAATTWAQLTSATGAKVTTKTKSMRKGIRCFIEVDIKDNRGMMREKETFDWDRDHGTEVEFLIDGRIQVNGDAGLHNYLYGNVLVNPHLTLHYKLPGSEKWVDIERVSDEIPTIPESTLPHPHTMKLGEFIAHSHLFGHVRTKAWLRKGFSRVGEATIKDLIDTKEVSSATLDKYVDSATDDDFRSIFKGFQKITLRAPSTQSVLSIGEESLAKSIQRLGEIDFFSVNSRRPTICDFKPVQVEVAVARLLNTKGEGDEPVSVLRFANRVPLQFDKAGCAIVQAINTVNWKPYGLAQPKKSLPLGPYIIAVSVVSPFIKFKNASKETVDSSEELIDELRRALMQAGQRLSRHLKREKKASELEQKIKHIEQFGPILVNGLIRITGASVSRKKKAEEGLKKILGRDTDAAEGQLKVAAERLAKHKEDQKKRLGFAAGEDEFGDDEESYNDSDGNLDSSDEQLDLGIDTKAKRSKKKPTKKPAKKLSTKKSPKKSPKKSKKKSRGRK